MATFNNLAENLLTSLGCLYLKDIKTVVNLTERDQLSSEQSLQLLKLGIKSHNFFDNPDLINIKKVKPDSRTDTQTLLRSKIRETIIIHKLKYIESLRDQNGDILFICNENNVLAPLFIMIIMSLKGYYKTALITLDNDSIIKQEKKETIKKYLDKYLDIIYNKLNEI
tara:strand:- start:200 stop:703 length:504 start_codon:yes stop_codon:yes gene_type:complete